MLNYPPLPFFLPYPTTFSLSASVTLSLKWEPWYTLNIKRYTQMSQLEPVKQRALRVLLVLSSLGPHV